MKKVFWENPYQSTLTTTVATVNGNEVTFNETIAYSFAGGQESDTATVNRISILSSRMEPGLIFYTLPDNHGLISGDQVNMVIDWPRRHKLMRLHFAAELVLEIVTQNYHLEKVGAHIAETKARIDFKAESNLSQYFETILTGFAQVPCGGTHVNTTGEVGYVTLKRERPGKGIERIDIRLCK